MRHLCIAIVSESTESFRERDHHTVRQIDQIESFGRGGVAELLQPELRGSFSMPPIDQGELAFRIYGYRSSKGYRLPVEHDPLRDSDNALLRLIQSRELRLDSIIRIRHNRSSTRRNKDEKSDLVAASNWSLYKEWCV